MSGPHASLPAPLKSGRAGMTLLEVLITITVFAIVIAGAMSYLQAQTKAFYKGSDRMVTLQNLRFATHRLETDIQTAGTNLVFGQPALIHAGADVLSFNADYATNVPSDAFAVFYDPGVPAGQVSAVPPSFVIPNSSFAYPDTLYRDPRSGTPSSAETITFYFEGDTTSTRTDDHILWRKVNDGKPEVVARNLLRRGGMPFLEYLVDTAPGIDTVSSGNLPLSHVATLHSGAADTGTVAAIDRVRGVVVNLGATNGLSGELEYTSELSRTIAMPNVNTKVLASCGGAPILGSIGLSASQKTSAGNHYVEVTWSAATDEAGGEQDILRYVIWRRTGSKPAWSDPYLSIPAGLASYQYDDFDVTSGESYQYALAAQDCTPRLSSQVLSASVNVP